MIPRINPGACTTFEILGHKQEYEIIGSLNLAGVVKAYSLEHYDRQTGIVLEDFGGESLKRLMQSGPFTLSESLSFALQIADILGELHAINIIQCDSFNLNIAILNHFQ